jgi:hypothetical protein
MRGLLAAGLVLLIAGCGGDASRDRAATLGAPTPAPAADTAAETRAKARDLTRDGKYLAAVSAYESAGLDDAADRVRQRGAATLNRSARRALQRGRYSTARRLATQSRRLRKTAAARTVLSTANAEIAKAAAAARERRRLARIARDAQTCSSSEKRAVRDGAGTPTECATYAAGLVAKSAAEEAEQAPEPASDCDPNYAGACLKPDSSDYDCAGGSGDGPDYTGAVESIGSDPYDLDRDGDGSACEG